VGDWRISFPFQPRGENVAVDPDFAFQGSDQMGAPGLDGNDFGNWFAMFGNHDSACVQVVE
jgi:hypothetical protein